MNTDKRLLYSSCKFNNEYWKILSTELRYHEMYYLCVNSSGDKRYLLESECSNFII